jgi:hypothetical protein
MMLQRIGALWLVVALFAILAASILWHLFWFAVTGGALITILLVFYLALSISKNWRV